MDTRYSPGIDLSARLTRAGSLLVATCAAVAVMVAGPYGQARVPSPPDPAKEKRLEWFRDAKYGLFIHWGLYAIPAGEWNGTRSLGIGEWIMNRLTIPVKDYEKLALRFNPVKFNADEWVRVAKDAGMKYIVITSKHHDGFAMFKSNASAYNIVDATPFKRDVLKELADAAARQGIRLGFYYSHDDRRPRPAFRGDRPPIAAGNAHRWATRD